jgi:hypothetical protein
MGMGKDVAGRSRRCEFAVAEEEAEEDRVVVMVLAPVVEEEELRTSNGQRWQRVKIMCSVFPCSSCAWWWY